MSKKHYSIWVRELGSDNEFALIEIDTNPGTIAKRLARKRLGQTHVRVYESVRIVDNAVPATN